MLACPGSPSSCHVTESWNESFDSLDSVTRLIDTSEVAGRSSGTSSCFRYFDGENKSASQENDVLCCSMGFCISGISEGRGVRDFLIGCGVLKTGVSAVGADASGIADCSLRGISRSASVRGGSEQRVSCSTNEWLEISAVEVLAGSTEDSSCIDCSDAATLVFSRATEVSSRDLSTWSSSSSSSSSPDGASCSCGANTSGYFSQLLSRVAVRRLTLRFFFGESCGVRGDRHSEDLARFGDLPTGSLDVSSKTSKCMLGMLSSGFCCGAAGAGLACFARCGMLARALSRGLWRTGTAGARRARRRGVLISGAGSTSAFL